MITVTKINLTYIFPLCEAGIDLVGLRYFSGYIPDKLVKGVEGHDHPDVVFGALLP